MTQDEIIEMAEQAGWYMGRDLSDGFGVRLEAFAKLVASKEHEACAEILDANAMACHSPIMRSLLQSNAQAI